MAACFEFFECLKTGLLCYRVQLKIIGMAQQSHIAGMRCLLFYGSSSAAASGTRVQLERVALADAHHYFLPEVQGRRCARAAALGAQYSTPDLEA